MKLRIILLFVMCLGFVNWSQAQSEGIPAHQTFTIASKVMKEMRTINVWTPEGYPNDPDSLPVLYLLDGGLQEDFPHVAHTVSSLVKAQKIPPVILVGIQNTNRRRDLTGPTEVDKDMTIAAVVGLSQQFRRFIQEELFAEIAVRYKANNKKGIMGESLAGLFVVETLILHPELFDCYIAFDPSLWWNNQFLVRTASAQIDRWDSKSKVFWFTSSATTEILEPATNLNLILKKINSPYFIWKFTPELNEQHNTIFRSTKEKAIAWTLQTLKL